MRFTQEAAVKAKHIKLLILDVDGVLTDGSIAIGATGELFKTFNVRDGLGITLAQKWGIKTAIITGRESQMLEYRAKELGITAFYQNCKNKIPAYEALLKEFKLTSSEVAYVGDDLFDLGIMNQVGLPATVADASDEAKQVAILESDYVGGKGAVRQIIEFILKAQGIWGKIVEEYMNSGKKEVDSLINQ